MNRRILAKLVIFQDVARAESMCLESVWKIGFWGCHGGAVLIVMFVFKGFGRACPIRMSGEGL